MRKSRKKQPFNAANIMDEMVRISDEQGYDGGYFEIPVTSGTTLIRAGTKLEAVAKDRGLKYYQFICLGYLMARVEKGEPKPSL